MFCCLHSHISEILIEKLTSYFSLFIQSLIVCLTFPKMFFQPSPLLRSSVSPVIPLPSLVEMKLFGVLRLKIFAPMHHPSQLTTSPCLLLLLPLLLMRLLPCLVEHLPSLVATPTAFRLVPLSVALDTHHASLLATTLGHPIVPPKPMHTAQPTGTCSFYTGLSWSGFNVNRPCLQNNFVLE